MLNKKKTSQKMSREGKITFYQCTKCDKATYHEVQTFQNIDITTGVVLKCTLCNEVVNLGGSEVTKTLPRVNVRGQQQFHRRG